MKDVSSFSPWFSSCICFGNIDFIVIILTLACSNNFVCIFLYMQRASLVGFFIFLFFYLPFFDLPFFIFPFFWFLVLLFVSFQSILAIFWCAICVTVIINLSVILSTLHLCYSYPCFLWSLGWCRPDVARTVLCLCCRSVV